MVPGDFPKGLPQWDSMAQPHSLFDAMRTLSPHGRRFGSGTFRQEHAVGHAALVGGSPHLTNNGYLDCCMSAAGNLL